MPVLTAGTNDIQVEAAARALFERDVRRSIGLAAADYVWPRVAPEYRLQAKAALHAAAAATSGNASP